MIQAFMVATVASPALAGVECQCARLATAGRPEDRTRALNLYGDVPSSREPPLSSFVLDTTSSARTPTVAVDGNGVAHFAWTVSH